MVEIDHGNGLKTRLAHLKSQQVKVGDRVKAGQIVALSGDTGTLADAGPHLHFEVWKDGRPIDPATIVALSTASTETSTMSANAMYTEGSVMVGIGNAQLNTGGKIIQADFIRWNRATGETRAEGHIVTQHPAG